MCNISLLIQRVIKIFIRKSLFYLLINCFGQNNIYMILLLNSTISAIVM